MNTARGTAARGRPVAAARLRLHLAALVLPLLIFAGALWFLPSLGRGDLVPAALAVAVAPQLAALCGWPLLRRYRSTGAAVWTGLAMGGLTHLFFGPVMGAAAWLCAGGAMTLRVELLGMAGWVSLVSLLVAGAISLPLTVAVAVHIRRFLDRECSDAR